MAAFSTSLSRSLSLLYSSFIRRCFAESDIAGTPSVVMSAEDPGISIPDNTAFLRRRYMSFTGRGFNFLNQSRSLCSSFGDSSQSFASIGTALPTAAGAAARALVAASAAAAGDVAAAALPEISASGYLGHVLVYVQLTLSPVLRWTVSVVPS